MSEKTSKRTKVEDIHEGTPLTFDQLKGIDADTLTEWMRVNHPECKEEYLSLWENEWNIVEKFKTVKGETGKKNETRQLTFFEIREWVCKKYNMYPVKQNRVPKKKRTEIIASLNRMNWGEAAKEPTEKNTPKNSGKILPEVNQA